MIAWKGGEGRAVLWHCFEDATTLNAARVVISFPDFLSRVLAASQFQLRRRPNTDLHAIINLCESPSP